MNDDNVIDINFLIPLGLANLRVIPENGKVIGIRGQTLSARKNHKHLKEVKAAGVNTVIDLRAADYNIRSDNVNFIKTCEAFGMEYRHFPVDRSQVADTVIIQHLPEMFEIINRGGFYIACAQGLHRTDIALALNFLFNPKSLEPPIMYGHLANGKFRCDDIFGRAYRIYRSMTEEDKNVLGWDEIFGKNFEERKKRLIDAQTNAIKNNI